MPAPLTLRQLSGAPDQPAALADSVVVVIDAQKEYTEGVLPLAGIDRSVAALAAFLVRARAAGVPVVHVVQIGKPGGPICAPGGPFVEVIEAVKPRPGEIVVKNVSRIRSQRPRWRRSSPGSGGRISCSPAT